mgnify:FL=1
MPAAFLPDFSRGAQRPAGPKGERPRHRSRGFFDQRPISGRVGSGYDDGMSSPPAAPVFFTKPSFRNSKSSTVLPGSARRALAAFDTGYRFSCTFFPGVPSISRSRAHLGFSGSRPATGGKDRDDGLTADELEHLLERNLLPRFDDERAAVSTRKKGFSPELIELSALLVIVGVVLAKIFVG